METNNLCGYEKQIEILDAKMLKYLKNTRVRNNICDCIDRADTSDYINISIINSFADMYEAIDKGGVLEPLFWYYAYYKMILTDDFELQKIYDRMSAKLSNADIVIASYVTGGQYIKNEIKGEK